MLSPRQPEGFLGAVVAEHGGALDPARLRRIGEGGTHAVYDRRADDPFVLKLPRELVDAPDPSRYGAGRRWAEAMARWHDERHERVRRHFGDWCVEQHSTAVPVLLSGSASPGWCPVAVQLRETAFDDPQRLRVGTPYFELERPGLDEDPVYAGVNAALLGDRPFDAGAYLELNPILVPCLAMALDDAAVRGLLAELSRRFRRYVESEGEVPDLAGLDNAVLVSGPGGWRLRLGSIAKNDGWAVVIEALAQLETGGPAALDHEPLHRAVLLNGLAAVRLVNALGLIVLGERVLDLRLTETQLWSLPRIDWVQGVDAPALDQNASVSPTLANLPRGLA